MDRCGCRGVSDVPACLHPVIVTLPRLPKLLQSSGAGSTPELTRRVDEWARSSQLLLAALRSGHGDLDARLRAVEAASGEGGSGSVAFGSPVGITIGGSNADGTSEDAARADHEHAIADFGTGSGDICEGDDARLSDDRTANAIRTATTVVSVSSAAAPSVGKVLRATSATTAEWASVPALYPRWDPNAPPVSAHSQDDEFDGSSLDTGKWTVYDQSSDLTITQENGFLTLECAAQSGNGRLAGVYQAVPSASSWAFATRMGIVHDISDIVQAGIFVAGSELVSAPTTADFYITRNLHNHPTYNVSFGSLTSYTSGVTALATISRAATEAYWRVRNISGNWYFDWSDDGISWVSDQFTPSFTPAYAGIWIRNVPAGSNSAYARAYWARWYDGTVNLNSGLPGGQYTD